MDHYKDYIQTNLNSEVDKYKKRGYEVVNIHTSIDGDRNEDTVFTLGLPYKTAYKQLLSLISDIEDHYSKKEIFELIEKQFGEKHENYEVNGFFETNNEFTNWMATYDRLVHNKNNTYFKFEKEKSTSYEDQEDIPMPF